MLSLLRCFEVGLIAAVVVIEPRCQGAGCALCLMLFALVRVSSDAETALADDQQYWALFELRVYVARGAVGLAQHLQSPVALRQIGSVAPRERLLACARRRESSFSLNRRRNPLLGAERENPAHREIQLALRPPSAAVERRTASLEAQ